MKYKIELDKCTIDLAQELQRYYSGGDLEDLEPEQWLREVDHLNRRIANRVMHLTKHQISRQEIVEVLK